MVDNTIRCVDPESCSGCAACMNICPHDCLKMSYDDEGFSIPVIDEDICVDCGMCKKVCPALHPKKDNYSDPVIFMARAGDDLLYESTSGGAFAILAGYVLEKKGYVCGAAYNDEFEVCHQITNSPEGLKKLKKSKYVQSQPGMVYREIKDLLSKDNYVLFSGSPCQVAGLHNYLGKDYDHLFTVDILCHGAPAPLMWKKYLVENFDISELDDIEFRYKNEKGARPLRMRFLYNDGKELLQRTKANPYYYHFSKDFGLRLSCGNCEGAVTPRVGDFSIGDFWGADVYHKDLVENAKGLSLIFCNNARSVELISYLKEKFTFIKTINLNEAMTKNRKHIKRRMPKGRTVFFEAIKNGSSFNDAVFAAKKASAPKYDVAIYGNTLGGNYGGLVTYYALYKACEQLGYSTVMIRPIKRKNSPLPQNEVLHGTRFCEEYINLSEAKTATAFHEYNDIADTFIIGSDQVWNQSLFKGRKLTFYLDFVDSNKKKIAYSSSFGYSSPQFLKEQQYWRPAVYHWMNQLDAVSVREADGVQICDRYYDIAATHMLDPVFLLDKTEYEKLASRAGRKQSGHFMTTYQLSPNSAIVNVMKYISEELGLTRINMGPGSVEKWNKKIVNTDIPWIPDIQTEEWIYNIANADFVVTDSFHGMCFAIMFRKKFILMLRKKGPSSRIESLLSKLGLKDRWFTSWKSFYSKRDIIHEDIDYDRVHSILNAERKLSLDWLKNAIESDKYINNSDIREILNFDETLKKPDSLSFDEYFSTLPLLYEDALIVAAFDSSETIAARSPVIQKGALIYMLNTSTNELLSSGGEYAHLSMYFGSTRIAASAGSTALGDENFRELILTYETHKDVYRCNKKNGFVAVLTKNNNDDAHLVLNDFVYVDEAGNISDLVDETKQ